MESSEKTVLHYKYIVWEEKFEVFCGDSSFVGWQI